MKKPLLLLAPWLLPAFAGGVPCGLDTLLSGHPRGPSLPSLKPTLPTKGHGRGIASIVIGPSISGCEAHNPIRELRWVDRHP
jgi:hypothetical protein